jgi:hypothetical protein
MMLCQMSSMLSAAFFVVMLSVIMLNAVMLNAIMLNVIILYADKLNAVMLMLLC